MKRLQGVLVPLVDLIAEAAVEEEVGELGDELLEVQIVPELADVTMVASDAHAGLSSPAS